MTNIHGFLERPLQERLKTRMTEILPGLEKEYADLGLTASAATARKIANLMKEESPTFKQLRDLTNELSGRLTDETASQLFFSVDEKKAPLISEKNLFGTPVTDAFPSATVDIEEAGKCLALGRSTACVFHLMRVMEAGLRALAKTLNDPNLDPATNPNWGRILSRGNAELNKPPGKRSPEWAKNEQFFADVTARLLAVKDAWRNPTMHVEISYDDEKALDVWNSVGSFMRHLATKLHE